MPLRKGDVLQDPAAGQPAAEQNRGNQSGDEHDRSRSGLVGRHSHSDQHRHDEDQRCERREDRVRQLGSQPPGGDHVRPVADQ